MRHVFTALLLIVSFNATAALVDNSWFTTDTNSGLDWLDLDQSTGLSLNNAETALVGWRPATNNEVEGIFWQLFDGFYDNASSYNSNLEGISSTLLSQSIYPAYTGHNTDALFFTSLFGFTQYQGYANRTLAYGLYIDEDGIPQMMGTLADITDGRGTIFGLEYEGEFDSNTTNTSYGIYLVRSTAVPVPAAIWLFASGLGLLGWFRRKA
jgi:hypothetical protein